VGGEGLYTKVSKTLASQAFGLGPSSPVKDGRGKLEPFAPSAHYTVAGPLVQPARRAEYRRLRRCGIRGAEWEMNVCVC
jgi:hypothetical protein